MPAGEIMEIELKYDVDPTLPAPDFTELAAVAGVTEPAVENLDAIYYDTENLDLAANKITLRRRSGGHDAGWHLKRPSRGAGRRELQVPLNTSRDQGPDGVIHVPDVLLEQIRVHTRGRALRPIGAISTHRELSELHGEDGQILAIFCNDTVTAQSLLPDGHAQAWTEWELELVDGDEKLLRKADKFLRSAGAETASSASKLARTIGPTPIRGMPSLGREPTAIDLVTTAIAQHLRHLTEQDPRVRAHEHDAVHQMRVATRRIRSVIAAYPTVLAGPRTEAVADELKLLAAILGNARDAEVQAARGERLLAGENASAAVTAALVGDQRHREQLAINRILSSLDNPRYFELLDEIERLVIVPERGPDADRKARAAMRDAVDECERKLRKASKRLRSIDDNDTADRQAQLHRIRKQAKQLRYSADPGSLLSPPIKAATARRAKAIQERLGDYNDAAISRAHIARAAGDPRISAADAFTLGRLDAKEEAAMAKALRRYRRLTR